MSPVLPISAAGSSALPDLNKEVGATRSAGLALVKRDTSTTENGSLVRSSRSQGAERDSLEGPPVETVRTGESDGSSPISRARGNLRGRTRLHTANLSEAFPSIAGSMSATNSDQKPAKDIVRDLMISRYGSPLKAWFHCFDRQRKGHCDIGEFRYGMNRLKYTGRVETLWEELDPSKLELIGLDILDAEEARRWQHFKRFVGLSFDGPKWMVQRLREEAGLSIDTDALTADEFETGLRACGWEEGHEKSLFEALETHGHNLLQSKDLKWVEQEVRMREAKAEAKLRFLREAEARAAAKNATARAKRDFKALLRQHHGHMYRAWRRVLDPDGTMNLQRSELFKACKQLSWSGDLRALWKALDYDCSGTTTFEELDPHAGRILAQVQYFAVEKYGKRPAQALWAAVDKRNKLRLNYQQFAEGLQATGFVGKSKTISKWLDWTHRGYLLAEDLDIFDQWKPPSWLVAAPNAEAAEQFKKALIGKYGHYLRGWRLVMDRDNSNICNWHEFVSACSSLKFTGDIAGAWLALDADMSGSISLEEIDADACRALVEFKRWATEEFGCVRAAFETMDVDGSGELDVKEFRLAMREYGFPGDAAIIFQSLDQSREKKLQSKEVMFLDSWDIAMDGGQDLEHTLTTLEASTKEATQCSKLIEYSLDGPGPAAYQLPSSFGVTSSFSSTTRFGGAFSFTGRDTRQCWLHPKDEYDLDYYNGAQSARGPQMGRKPAWGFGSAIRPSTVPENMDEVRRRASPGPGAYNLRPGSCGPKFSMAQRTNIAIHPSQRAPFGRGPGAAFRRAHYRP